MFIHLLGLQLNPMFGAAAMSLSSFSVVSNALRLNLFKLYDPRRDRNIRGSDADKNSTEIKTETKENKTMKKTVTIEGMMCGHCEMHVKNALEALDGVTSAEVSHEAGTAVVTLAGDVSDDTMKKAVEDQGYKVTAVN